MLFLDERDSSGKTGKAVGWGNGWKFHFLSLSKNFSLDTTKYLFNRITHGWAARVCNLKAMSLINYRKVSCNVTSHSYNSPFMQSIYLILNSLLCLQILISIKQGQTLQAQVFYGLRVLHGSAENRKLFFRKNQIVGEDWIPQYILITFEMATSGIYSRAWGSHNEIQNGW